MRHFLHLLLLLPVSVVAQSKPVSIAFSSKALSTVRCLKEAKSPEETTPCQSLMNEVDDVRRSPTESALYRAIAQYASGKIVVLAKEDAAFQEVTGEWAASHPLEGPDPNFKEKMAGKYHQEPYKSLFLMEALCETQLDNALRSGKGGVTAACASLSERAKN